LYGKYNIILFENNKKKKLIKKYNTLEKAIKKYNTLLSDNKKILFEKQVQNFDNCSFFLGLISNEKKIQDSIYLTDDLGRNIPVNLNNSEYVFLELKSYRIEEKIYDWQTEKKITLSEFLINYLKSTDLKNISIVNNKIFVQENENFYLFSLKNKDESKRFLGVLEDYFIDNGRMDAIFVYDTSLVQRKWIYSVLINKGFDKKRLYRLKTTFSKR